MASPFNLFRKNQRMMIAVLIGLSMFAFIVAGSINETNAPVFLGVILGALGLWLLSNKGGSEGWLIAAVGGIVGGFVGAFAPGWFGQDAAVYTSEGNLTHTEIAEIIEDQQDANEFLGRAFNLVVERTPEEEQRQLTSPAPFRFLEVVNQPTAERNAALTYLFGKKADEMGITLTDEAVQQYILDATNGELTKSEFEQVRSQLRVGTSKLFDMLREQLRAREAYRLLSPVGAASLGPSAPTPQELWNEFKKLKEEATVAITTLPVEEFVAQVEEPSEAELQAYFERYKTQMPLPNGTPGFRIPRQVRVAYVEILASEIRENVTPPTQEEILAHYEANKARYEFSQQMPGQGEAEAAPSSTAPAEAPRPKTSGADADGTTMTETAPEDSAQPASQSPAADNGQTNPKSPAEAVKPPSPESAPATESSAVISRDGTMFVSFQPEGKTAKPATSAGASAVQAGKPSPPSDSKASPAAKADDAKESASAGPKLPQIPEEGAMKTPAADEAAKSAGDMPTSVADSGADDGPSKDTLARIREELMAQRVRDALDARQIEVRDRVDEILQEVMSTLPLPPNPEEEQAVRKYESARTAAIAEAIDRIEKFAKQHDDLQWHFTPAMSYEDLVTSDDYPVGQALRWRENQPPFGADNTPIADLLFGSPPDAPLLPIGGRSMLNNSRYVLFKAADLASRVPEFTEEGVQEQVTQAWKLVEARKLAEQRAAELVVAANETEGPLAKAIEKKTVTGQTPGEELTVEEIGPFTWLTRSSVPSRGMAMPAIVPTTLPRLPAAGEEFMETVFETTGVGKAGMAPSVDRQSFYVVQVKSRTPEKELQAVREEFMKEDFFGGQMMFAMNPYRRQAITEAMQVRQQWLENFLERHEFVQAGAIEP